MSFASSAPLFSLFPNPFVHLSAAASWDAPPLRHRMEAMMALSTANLAPSSGYWSPASLRGGAWKKLGLASVGDLMDADSVWLLCVFVGVCLRLYVFVSVRCERANWVSGRWVSACSFCRLVSFCCVIGYLSRATTAAAAAKYKKGSLSLKPT